MSDSNRRKLYIFIGITFLVRLFLATMPLSNGEAYYARAVMDVQLSYFDQPPLSFWLPSLFVKIFGVHSWSFRLTSILFFSGTTWLLYKICCLWYNEKAAWWSILYLNMTPVLSLVFGTFLQPDSVLLFFWLASFYLTTQILLDSSDWSTGKIYSQFVQLGVVLGLSFLSKYYVVFTIFSVFTFLLVYRQYRHWIFHPGPYISLVIMILIASPIFIWNYDHDFISFTFQGSRAGATESTLRWDWLLRSIGGQALYLLPWVFIMLLIQVPKLMKTAIMKMHHRFLLFSALPPILFFTVITLWSDQKFHFHWQTPGYILLFIPLGHWFESLSKQRKKLIKWFFGVTTAITLSLAVLLVAHVKTGVWSTFGPKSLAVAFKNKNDPTIFVNDFKQLKGIIEKHGLLDREEVFLGTRSWWIAGLFDQSIEYSIPLVSFDKDPRNYAYLSDPVKHLGEDCIFPSHHKLTPKNEIHAFFESFQLIDSCWIERYEGEKELKLYLYKGTHFQIPLLPLREIPVYAQLINKAPFFYQISTFNEQEAQWETRSKHSYFYNSFETSEPDLRSADIAFSASKAHQGKQFYIIRSYQPFSQSFSIDSIAGNRIELSYWRKNEYAEQNIQIGFKVLENGKYRWLGTKKLDLSQPHLKWSKETHTIALPQNEYNSIKFYFFAEGKLMGDIWLDDLEVKTH